MNNKKYRVIEYIGDISKEKVLAERLDLDIALLLVKAYCEKYFEEPINLAVTEERTCSKE